MPLRETLLSRHRIPDPYYQIHHNPGILQDAVDFHIAEWVTEPNGIGIQPARHTRRAKYTTLHMFSRIVYRTFTLIWFFAYFLINRFIRLLR